MPSHKTSHANPSDPTIRKAHRHPKWSTTHGTISGVSIAPRFVPALNIPFASALSFAGNHSETHFVLAGNTPASQKPNAPRANAKPTSDPQAAWAIEAMLQKNIASA